MSQGVKTHWPFQPWILSEKGNTGTLYSASQFFFVHPLVLSLQGGIKGEEFKKTSRDYFFFQKCIRFGSELQSYLQK